MTQTNTGLSGPTIISRKKTVVLDATLLSALMGCGRLVDLRFNHNLTSMNGKSNSLEAGSMAHKGLEVYYKMRMHGYDHKKSMDVGMIGARLYADGCPYCSNFVQTDELLTPICGHSVNEYPGVQNTPEESEGYLVGTKHVLDTLEQYWKHYEGDHWVTLGVERVEGKILYEDDEIIILWKAKLDWKVDTNQGIFPVDHKTSKQRRKKIKLNNQFMGQCLVTGGRTMIVNEIGFQKTLKPSEKFLRPMFSYSSEALAEWQGVTLPYWAYRLLDYQESGYWPPNLTHCENKYGNCPFISACEADPHMRLEELKLYFIKGPDWDPINDTGATEE